MSKDAFYETKPTSPGYRFPLYKRPQTAAVSRPPPPPHRSTVPAHQQSSSGRRSAPPAASRHEQDGGVDPVSYEKIWTESLLNEKRRNRAWQTQWGFMTQFDQLGRPRTAVDPLPDGRMNSFSTVVPSTDSRQYGSRTSTPVGQRLQTLEYKFYSDNRKRRLGNEFVCY